MSSRRCVNRAHVSRHRALYAFRESYAAQFDYDVKKMFADLEAFGVNNPARRASIKPVEPKRTPSS